MANKFFSWLFGSKPVETPEVKSIIIPPDQEQIKLKVDNLRMENVERSLTNLAIILHRVIDEQKKTQDFIVQLSTLHEELLNALDQGNIAFVKVRQQDVEEIDALMRQEEPEFSKKKQDLN